MPLDSLATEYWYFRQPVIASPREADVERINQFHFYRLARSLSELSNFRGNAKPSDVLLPLLSAQTSIDALLRDEPIPLGVSKSAAQALHTQLDLIERAHFSEKTPNGGHEFALPSADAAFVEGWRFDMWRRALETFETVFSAEMSETASYYIPRRGIYDTAALIDQADSSFPEDLQWYINEKTRTDWRAAGRCLALSLFTAAGFHAVRAVEGTLETYYQRFTGQPDKTEAGWHDYLKPLEGLPDGTSPMPDAKTLAALRQMKDDYRNPVVHPRVVLTEADARMLFNNGETAIIGMAQGLRDASEGTQPVLSLDGSAKETA